MNDKNTAPRKVSDYIKPIPPFYPDARQVNVAEIVNDGIVVLDVQIRRDMPGNFGRKDTILFAFTKVDNDGETLTAFSSHAVLYNRLKTLKDKRAFPVIGKIVEMPSKDEEKSPYFDLVDIDFVVPSEDN